MIVSNIYFFCLFYMIAGVLLERTLSNLVRILNEEIVFRFRNV